MRAKWKEIQAGMLAFGIVLLLMPLGHALMVLNEQVLHGGRFTGALVIGGIGAALLAWGIRVPAKATKATLLGLIGTNAKVDRLERLERFLPGIFSFSSPGIRY